MTRANVTAPDYGELVRLLIRLHMVFTGPPPGVTVDENRQQIDRSYLALVDMLDRIAIAQVADVLPGYDEVVPRLEPDVAIVRDGRRMAELLESFVCPVPELCGEAFCAAGKSAAAAWRERWDPQ